jgi:hypothetical protein
MLQSFTVRNFRAFRDLTVEPLKRVNLIAGKNNVGKTALLEALFLASGPNVPELTVRVAQIRRLDVKNSSAEDVWSGLFYGKLVKTPFELVSSNSGHGEGVLRVSLRPSSTAVIAAPGSPALGLSSSVPYAKDIPGLLASDYTNLEIVYEYDDGSQEEDKVSLAWLHRRDDETIISTERYPLPSPAPAYYLTSAHGEVPGLAELYSNAVQLGREQFVLESLQALEPRLSRLTLLMLGKTPIVHGDIGIGALLPVNLMGGGTGRLLSILLTIVSAAGGMVLIDEVENGFHYSALGDVWQTIDRASLEANAQIFATTHSFECIQAAHEAFGRDGHSDDMRLIRLDRVDGEIRSTNYRANILEAAIETGLEVR